MTQDNRPGTRPAKGCDVCAFRQFADKAPTSLFARLWKWHTRFCPGWKRYVKSRFEHGESAPDCGCRHGYWKD